MLEKIPIDSEEYIDHNETMKDFVEEGSVGGSWGSGVLFRLNFNERLIKSRLDESNLDQKTREKEITELERTNEKLLKDSLAHFVGLQGNQERGGHCIFLIVEVMRNESIRGRISSLLFDGKSALANTVIKAMIKSVNANEFPLDLWRDMLAENEKSFNKKLEMFQNDVLPPLKEKFLQSFGKIENEGLFPFSGEELAKIIDSVGFTLRDPTEANLENNRGRYVPGDNAIFIASHLVDSYLSADKNKEMADSILKTEKDMSLSSIRFFEQMRASARDSGGNVVHTFYHEMIHMLSGKTVVSKKEDEDNLSEPAEFIHKKIGVQHHGMQIVRFRWLNEAITEHLTLNLIGDNSVKFIGYPKELELFELLRTKGKTDLPIELFTDAFFENFDPRQPKEDQLRHWRNLRDELGKAYSQDFIVSLDRTIQEKGIDVAIAIVKSQKTEK